MLLPKFSVKAALSRSLARPARISAAGARAVELECSGSNRGAQAVAAEPSIGGQPRPQPASKHCLAKQRQQHRRGFGRAPTRAASRPVPLWQSPTKCYSRLCQTKHLSRLRFAVFGQPPPACGPRPVGKEPAKSGWIEISSPPLAPAMQKAIWPCIEKGRHNTDQG